MLNKEDLKKVKKNTQEFFEKIGFEVEIEFLPQEDLTLPINLNMEEPQILIGEGGQTLAEIQHLLKAILRRKISEPFYINLDINNYKNKKSEYLKELANSTADDVALMKKEKSLAPMPAYERRIIHLELINRADVVTESIDQGPERRIIIKPAP